LGGLPKAAARFSFRAARQAVHHTGARLQHVLGRARPRDRSQAGQRPDAQEGARQLVPADPQGNRHTGEVVMRSARGRILILVATIGMVMTAGGAWAFHYPW